MKKMKLFAEQQSSILKELLFTHEICAAIKQAKKTINPIEEKTLQDLIQVLLGLLGRETCIKQAIKN